MLGVLVNPRARGARRDPALPTRLARIVGELGEVLVTEAATLPTLAAELAARDARLVAICGGDGTGQTVLSALVRAYQVRSRPPPRIALLRGGTMNTVARNLGLRGDPEHLLTRLCDRLRQDRPLPVVSQQLLAVNERLGFIFAAALGARFLELYYETPEPGPADAARLALALIASTLARGPLAQRIYRPAALILTSNGGAPRRLDTARLLVAATVPDLGLGMRICPRARDAPGRFQLIASGLTPDRLARQLGAVQAGRALVGEPHIDRLVTSAELNFDEEEPYTVDGELFRARRVLLAAGPRIELVRA